MSASDCTRSMPAVIIRPQRPKNRCIQLLLQKREIGVCHVLAALSCYRLSHRDSTFVNWTAEQHLHDRCGLRDRTCVVSVACLALSVARGDRPVNRGGHQVTTSAACPAVEWAVLRWTLARTDQRLDGCGVKKARARRYRGRLTSVCVLCCRPRGMLEAASSGASGSASFGRVPSHC